MMPCPPFRGRSASCPSDRTPGSCSDSPPVVRRDLALHSESFGSCPPSPTPLLLASLILCAGTRHGQGQVVLFSAYNLPPTLHALAAHRRPWLDRHPLLHGGWGTGEDYHSPSLWADRIKLAHHFLVLQNGSAKKRKQTLVLGSRPITPPLAVAGSSIPEAGRRCNINATKCLTRIQTPLPLH